MEAENRGPNPRAGAKSKYVKKAWGHEEWIVNTKDYCGKRLVLNSGWRCSLHRHHRKDETFFLESGLLYVEAGRRKFLLQPGESLRIRPGTWHRFWGMHRSVIIEFSTHHSDADVERKEDSAHFDVIPDYLVT